MNYTEVAQTDEASRARHRHGPYEGLSGVGQAVAVVVMLLLTAVLSSIQPLLSETDFRIPYVLGVAAIAYYFGAGPAITGIVLSVLGYSYLYITGSPFSYSVEQWTVVIVLSLGLAIISLPSLLLRKAVIRNAHVKSQILQTNEDLRREVSQRERAEAALERSERRFRNTFEYAGIGMTVIDMQGYVLTANPAFAEFSGYSLEELPGMNVQQYAYPDDLAHGNELLFEMIEGKRESYQVEKRYIRKDGSVIWGRLTASIARNPEPEPPFIIGMIENVTDRKLAEQREQEMEAAKMDFYRRTITAATGGKFVISEASDIHGLCQDVAPAKWHVAVPADLPEARRRAIEVATAEGMDEERAWEFATCVGEALTNAIKHAGGGHACLCGLDDGLLFVLSDHGPGIPALSLPEVAFQKGYSTAGTLGMGYKVMLALADRVYLATGPEGTTVAVEMKLKPEVGSAAGVGWASSLG